MFYLQNDVSDMDGRQVTFTDGSTVEDIDVIILCTGYKIENKFLDSSLMPVGEVGKCKISVGIDLNNNKKNSNERF